MSESDSIDGEIPLREEKPSHPFFWIGNEFFDLYVPIIGPDCFAVYAYFARNLHSNPILKHSLKDIARSCGIKLSTASRSREVLESLQLIYLICFEGSRKSECSLPDAWTVANRLGAQFDRETQSYRFPESVSNRLRAEVREIRARQQGKTKERAATPVVPACGNLEMSVSQRNTSLPPEKPQRSTRETQTGPHLLRKEERIERILTPTPFHRGEAGKAKALPDENGTVEDLRWARAKFNGFMHDLKNHLLAPRPQFQHLTKGSDDWGGIRL